MAERPIPTFLYYCLGDTNELHMVSLLTGEKSCHEVPHYQFNSGCRRSELPGGDLLITGGGWPDARDEVVKIDTSREYAVCSLPPMHTARSGHAAVYHSQYLYVLAGYNYGILRECERYSFQEGQWEMLPALPVAGTAMSAMEVDNSVYTLGGSDYKLLDTVQKLSLDSLTWQLMQLKLPQAAWLIPCFKTDTEVYLVINKTLYSFTPLQVKAVRTLDRSCECLWSYYSRGTLYYDCSSGIESLELNFDRC
jgi:hypothetical protein